MSVNVRKVNVSLSPYIIRLGYIRRLHSRPLDVWTFSTHEPDYLLHLPSHMLHTVPLESSVHLWNTGNIQVHVDKIPIRPMKTTIRRVRMWRVWFHRMKMLLHVNIRKKHVLLDTRVHTILGFYGVPIKRRGIPGDKVSPSVYHKLRIVLMRRKIKLYNPKLAYYFPHVAITPSGKIKYLGNGYLLVIPGRGTKLIMDVFIVRDNKGKEHMVVGVV